MTEEQSKLLSDLFESVAALTLRVNLLEQHIEWQRKIANESH